MKFRNYVLLLSIYLGVLASIILILAYSPRLEDLPPEEFLKWIDNSLSFHSLRRFVEFIMFIP